MATHSSILALEIPGTVEADGLQSKESDMTYQLNNSSEWLPRWFSDKESTSQCKRLRRHGFDSWSRNWQPNPVFLPRDPMDRGTWWAPFRGVTESWTQLSG